MKKFLFSILFITGLFAESHAQCNVTAEITEYVPGYCYYYPSYLVGTPNVDCPDASFIVIKWIADGIVHTTQTTTDFTSPSYANIDPYWFTTGPTIVPVCFEVHVFNSSNMEIAVSSACQADVLIPTYFTPNLSDCDNGCFSIGSSTGYAQTFTASINNGDLVSLGIFEDYCFDAPGTYNVIISDEYGCLTEENLTIEATMLDDLHDITGMLYNDVLGDGNIDWTDPILPSVGYITLEELNLTSDVDANGYFNFYQVPEGTYTLTFTDDDNIWISSLNYDVMATSGYCWPVQMAATALPEMMLAESHLANIWSPTTINCETGFNPGVWVNNTGNLPLNGTVTMTFDPMFVPDYLTGVEPYDSFNAGVMTWNIIDQAPGTALFYQCHINGPGFEFMGEIFSFNINLHLVTDVGSTFVNNDWLEDYTVVCSFDPNDKNAVPEGYAAPHFILAEDEIEYRIRFQNTGNAPANNVEVVDSLDLAHLDLSTFETVFASHSVNTVVDLDGVVHFQFDNINLPDSASDEPGSQGYVVYKIKTLPDVQPMDEINNTAYIYFDANPAIVTNTTHHTIYDCARLESISGTQTICADSYLTANPVIDTYAEGISWSYDGVTQQETGASIAILEIEVGLHTLELTLSNPLCSVTSSMTIEVLQYADVTLVYDDNTGLISGPSGYNYTWYANGVLQSTASGNTFDPSLIGSNGMEVYAMVSSDVECEIESNTIFVVGLNELPKSKLLVYPNPMSESCLLMLDEGNWNVHLFNSLGAKSGEWNNVQKTLTIEKGSLSAGIYTIKAMDRNGKVNCLQLEIK